jgi:hypothetical protein
LRRGRCWGCYERWVDARPVGLGARCVTCNEKRRRFLRIVELFGSWKPMCFNCHGVIGTLDPMPQTVAGLKDAISRERRSGREAELPSVDDDMIIEVTIDSGAAEVEFDDITAIRELVAELRPSGLAG